MVTSDFIQGTWQSSLFLQRDFAKPRLALKLQVEGDLELLPLSLECWLYSSVSSYLVYTVLRMELKSSMQDGQSL